MKRTENGTFATGNKGGGRVKGSQNKATGALREFINDFVNDNKDKVQADFDSLEPKERIDAIIKLMEFAVPKLQRTQLEADVSYKNEVVINLVEEEKELISNE